MIEIFSLTNDQIDQVVNIEQCDKLSNWDKKTFIIHTGKKYFNLCLSLNKTIVGFAITQVIIDEASLLKISIHPIYQRRGYGSKLLEYLIKKLQQRNIFIIWLEVRISNFPAIYFYEKLGFNCVHRRLNYYKTVNGYEDAMIMARSII
ncbi:ribosomal protein S18-alanine N-acetyltransferase [Candidatus Ishikawella capsulata]|uniref:[Ribosomal protein bS18]-alanine N-acetyltransferase n=1 Tax=Candidatus Ishikawaella capsulata Mpkobe TaxID=476281 RepID=C5WCV3_9ENTR|nr:ribosomal protein S18-alanine N-acetyltransferase [Candidatus Ishikawaella capsulata]BAH83159.1 ribosomal-protein-alanine N-acetyltransferase [Candidatus Ishikawaella capsulata Mpkobe]